MKQPTPSVPALTRGLRLIEWFARQDEPATLTQVAAGLGLSVSEVQRPVACLEEEGYLRRLGSGGYELSGRMLAVASQHPPHAGLRRLAEGPMRAFARVTGQSVHLSVPDGDAALMILDVPGEGLVRLSLRPGARFRPDDTLSGALLADAGVLTCTGRILLSARERQKLKSHGWLARDSAQVAGVRDFGLVLRGANGRVLGAMACCAAVFKRAPLDEKKVVLALQRAARAISSLKTD